MNRFLEKYRKEVVPKMKERFGYKNELQVPKITKVVINTGIGKIVKDAKMIEHIVNDVALISGQKPIITKAKKSIAAFKVREGMPMGVKVTLRKDRMYEFLDKLANVSLPRIRDFRGISAESFDNNGNYSVGIKEHIVFPEISSEDIKQIFGLEIGIVTTAKNKEEARALLELSGFKFKAKE